MKLEIIKVLDVPGEKSTFEGQLNLSWIKRLGETLFPESLAVEGYVVNQAGIVTLHYQIKGVFPFKCDRCLMQTEKIINESFDHIVVRSLEDETLDDTFIVEPKGIIDLDEIAGNDLLLSMPTVFLCNEDCKGLCQKCGTNLNNTQCGCHQSEGDPRLAVLKKLLNNEGGA